MFGTLAASATLFGTHAGAHHRARMDGDGRIETGWGRTGADRENPARHQEDGLLQRGQCRPKSVVVETASWQLTGFVVAVSDRFEDVLVIRIYSFLDIG